MTASVATAVAAPQVVASGKDDRRAFPIVILSLHKRGRSLLLWGWSRCLRWNRIA